MSSPRQIVRDYLEASEDLMKLKDLTYAGDRSCGGNVGSAHDLTLP